MPIADAAERERCKHFFGHVDADDFSIETDLIGRDERVEARTRPDVDNPLAFGKRSQCKWARNPSEGLHGHVGKGFDKFVIVAEPVCQIAAGVEMIGPVRIGCDLAIFAFDFLAERGGVDGNFGR